MEQQWLIRMKLAKVEEQTVARQITATGRVVTAANRQAVVAVLGRGETTFAVVMAGLGLGSSLAAVLLGRAAGRYERGARDRAVLHGRRHAWAARALLAGGAVLGLLLLPGALRPPLVIFALLWVLNGAGQALIAIPSSTLLAEHTAEEERGRAYAAHFALTHACWLVTYLAVGHAASRWGSPATFTAAGVLCLLVTASAAAVGKGAGGAHSHERVHAGT